ncbi:uncharacterized protein BYT42DRAFT_577316 [Radiomyces spectabilis]|uniref:uncharacterized protein n=1 Tax=Radiomyces spectabilis TaxID=64574 RepID=UPI00221ECECD|nr:uncharacterized protein BYT42DRAFT_577316 [Radiomyces spectabilis]KAI8374695.1 hypothetical protein BYT42DRAFT_577316 [Radiomyces spectabilis]
MHSSTLQTPHSQRRVSFDLDHNTVHVLPTLEECRLEASRRGREQWERKTLLQDMLDESIILEIQQDCCSCSRNTDDNDNGSQPVTPCPLKSCLKKPVSSPTVSAPKKTMKKTTHKKRKRSHGKGCAVEARMQPFLDPNLPIH